MFRIQEHRMGRVGMSPPHPWLNLPGSFGAQQAEQGVGMAMDCLPGELVTMRREGGRKSLQSWERSSLQIHSFPSPSNCSSASEQSHITPGTASNALGAAPINHPSSGVQREARGRISISATLKYPSKHCLGLPHGMVWFRGGAESRVGEKEGWELVLGVREPWWGMAMGAKAAWGGQPKGGTAYRAGSNPLTSSIFKPQMVGCKAESPHTALVPAAPPGTDKTGASAEGPFRVATAQNRPLKAFQHPVLEKSRAEGGGSASWVGELCSSLGIQRCPCP